MDSIFQNPKALTAKKRQPCGSPSRIIQNHAVWASKEFGRECKWCGTWNDSWPKDQMWLCDSCSKV